MQISGGGTHVHHHGVLAGVSAGAAGVLAGLVILLAAWRQVSHAIGEAATVLVWALAVGAVVIVAYEIAVRVLRLRYHVLHPETLVRQSVRAEVIPGQFGAPPTAALPAAQPVAALPAGTHHTWRLPNDPEAAIAVIRAIKAEGLAGVPSDAGELPR